MAADYDVIGFDPRGVGASVPALHCDPTFFSGDRPDYIPATAAAERRADRRAKSYAEDCETQFGWLLPHMTTANIARDMDPIRAALGQPKISYFAFSYGTYLGQVYATMFPTRVRRMVLDSTVDPRRVWYRTTSTRTTRSRAGSSAFFAWVASPQRRLPPGHHRGAVGAAWHQARRQLGADPAARA